MLIFLTWFLKGGIIKFALWEREALLNISPKKAGFKLSKMDSTHRNVHNVTENCLFDPFLLKCIHISTYLVKKRDPYKIFRPSLKIS